MIDLRQFDGWEDGEMPDSFHVDSVAQADKSRVVTLMFRNDSEGSVGVILPWDGARAVRDKLTEVLEGRKADEAADAAGEE